MNRKEMVDKLNVCWDELEAILTEIEKLDPRLTGGGEAVEAMKEALNHLDRVASVILEGKK